MKFSLYDHAGKAAHLRETLEARGHTHALLEEADILILDCDWQWAHPRPALIDAAVARGVKVALYPHGGQSTVFVYDGLTPADERVDVRFEHGPGPQEVAALLGLDLNQENVGWLYSPTQPFKPVENPVKVLFAPMHPNIEALQAGTNGHDPAPALNQAVYRALLKLGFEVGVSVVGPIWRNGLWPHPRAQLLENPTMSFPASYDLIEQADVVVAAGTLAAAAVAAGKPLVMLGGHDCQDYVGGHYVKAHRAGEYEQMFRYPLNFEDGDLDALIHAACAGTDQTAEWRARWVGNDGADRAVDHLEALVGVPSSANVTIAGATARSGAHG